MKTKKILFSLLTLLITFIGVTVKASTTAPNSFTVNSKDLYQINGSKYLKNTTIKFYYKKNTAGEIVYCTEINDLPVKSGQQIYKLGKELDSRYAYVIENGYPNKRIFDGGEKDYFTTALTIWYLVDSKDPVFQNFNVSKGTYNGSYSDVVNAMKELINSANNYSYTNPTINFNILNDNLVLSEDGKYYTSEAISVVKTGSVNSYKVSLENAPKGTIVTDKNGNEKNEFNINETFIVKVPASNVSELENTIKVNVTSTGSINKAYVYNPADSSYQSVAALYPEYQELNLSTTLKLHVEPKVSTVEISKQDMTTSEEIPGAKLELKNDKGEVVEAWISESTPHKIEGLEPGKYYLTEIMAPDGYELSTETVEFIVKEDGTVDGKVVMYNKPETVVVPSTSSFKTIWTSLIGIITIGLGSLVLYKNYKKNEEK